MILLTDKKEWKMKVQYRCSVIAIFSLIAIYWYCFNLYEMLLLTFYLLNKLSVIIFQLNQYDEWWQNMTLRHNHWKVTWNSFFLFLFWLISIITYPLISKLFFLWPNIFQKLIDKNLTLIPSLGMFLMCHEIPPWKNKKVVRKKWSSYRK